MKKYSEFLESYRVQELVRKYSDYIRYPIRMEVEKSRMKEQPEGEEADEEKAPEYETYTEVETLNSMVPIWRKNKNELTDEDYNSFYKEKFFDYSDPLKVIHTYTEGAATYHALLFIPAKAPYNTTRAIMKRASSSMSAACSSWIPVRTCYPITSALSRAWWIRRISP